MLRAKTKVTARLCTKCYLYEYKYHLRNVFKINAHKYNKVFQKRFIYIIGVKFNDNINVRMQYNCL